MTLAEIFLAPWQPESVLLIAMLICWLSLKHLTYSLPRGFFGLRHRLEDSLGCKVDLLTINGLRNPYFRHSAI